MFFLTKARLLIELRVFNLTYLPPAWDSYILFLQPFPFAETDYIILLKNGLISVYANI